MSNETTENTSSLNCTEAEFAKQFDEFLEQLADIAILSYFQHKKNHHKK